MAELRDSFNAQKDQWDNEKSTVERLQKLREQIEDMNNRIQKAQRNYDLDAVDEPTVEDTISILRGLKERYEVFHGVKITDSALVAAATLSDRYISDRFLPDKAIDLVDEACALIKTELDSMPTELDEMRRKIMQMEIEEAALKKENDRLSQDRLVALQKEMAELRDSFNAQKAQWDNEKSTVERLQKLREQIEDMNNKIQKAQRNYDLDEAAKLQYGELVEDTISILRGLKERYEVFHGVKITDSALVAAATLSDRYISDRFLPDKAIDLVDEACALIKTELDSMPTELDEMRRKIMQMEIEEAALKKENDRLSQDRLVALQKEMAELRDSFNAQKAQWDNEKSTVERLQKLREQIEDMNNKIQKAQRNYDLDEAAKLQYGELPKLQKQLQAEEEKVKNQDLSLVHESVTDEEIARIISRWTGIPVAKLTEGERTKILHLEEELHKRGSYTF